MPAPAGTRQRRWMRGGWEMDALGSFKHSFSNTLRENLGLAVYNTGYQKCGPHHAWGPAARDHYLIHYVASGAGTYVCEGKRHTISTGDLFLIFPSQVVSYAADPEDPWEYYWVGFQGTEAKRMINLAGFRKDKPVLRMPEGSDIRSFLLRIYESRGSTPSADAAMIGYLYLFLGRLIQENRPHQPEYGTREYLEQALRFIQYNYAGDIGVSDIASYAGISRSQLYRAFVAYFTISPNEFLQKYRINEACSLLRSGRFTVTEVAGSVGYADPLYFSRVFKKVKGMTPTEYQLRCASSGEPESSERQEAAPDAGETKAEI